jgi:predicted DsbA family dithiol-disulfide isomerase
MIDASWHGQPHAEKRERVDFTVYSDFTCAECYGLNEQLAALGVSGAVQWRGVQVEPALATPMRSIDRRALDRIEDEISEVLRRVGDTVMHLPRGKPNTRKAIVAVASVMRQQPARAAVLRDALFRAYWRDGTDLSVMGEVQAVADRAGVPRFVQLDDPDADEMVENWDLDWATERLGGVPRVIRGDGKILWGLRSMIDAAEFFRV